MKCGLLIWMFIGLISFENNQIKDTISQKINRIAHKHVDAVARFQNGDFNRFLTSHIIYHNIKDNISGAVVLLVSIEATGDITKVEVLKGIDPEVDGEVVKTVKSSPPWKPAMLDGKPTSMQMVLTVNMAIFGSGQSNQVQLIKRPASPPLIETTKPYPVRQLPFIAKSATAPKPTQALKTETGKVIAKNGKPAGIVVASKPALRPIAKVPKPKALPAKKDKPVITKASVVAPSKKPVAPQVPKTAKAPGREILAKALKPTPKPTLAKSQLQTKPAAKKTEKPKPIILKQKPPLAATINQVITLPVKPRQKPVLKVVKLEKPATNEKPASHTTKADLKPSAKLSSEKRQNIIAAIKTKPKRKKANNSNNIGVVENSFKSVEIPPRFPGGENALYRYLSTSLVYPDNSKQNKIEGPVSASFYVEKDGTVGEVKILSSPADDLSNEAIRILTGSPKWQPGFQNGNYVRVSYTVTINFRLN